jgi:hypothetical protein
MSGRGSRQKGAGAERELFGLLNTELGHDWFKRNLLQTRQGGCDDQNAEVFALEVKRQEKQALHEWIAQTLEQAKPGQLPVLAYRRNHEPWKILLVLDVSGFCKLFKRLCGLDVSRCQSCGNPRSSHGTACPVLET